MTHGIEQILEQWRRERPDLDVSPMAVIGRLGRLGALVDTRLARTFTRHGLDAASFDVLATLLRAGDPYELSPRHLAESAMITTSAVAQRLNRLDAAGLIERLPDPEDRRGVRVRLTAEGRSRIEAALPEHLHTEEKILARLSPEQREQLCTLLDLLEP